MYVYMCVYVYSRVGVISFVTVREEQQVVNTVAANTLLKPDLS
jgi:hypothetical protein